MPQKSISAGNSSELPRKVATEEQRQTFLRRGGHCNGDTNSSFHPSVWPIAETHVFLGGLGGEYGRAFLWRATDTSRTRITASLLMGRLGLPNTPEILVGLEKWLSDLSSEDALFILDLAYGENRVAPWGNAQFCCDPTLVRHAPLLTFRGIELMYSLPPDWKRSNRFGAEIIKRLWPELLEIPFNSLGFPKNLLIKLERALNDPRVIMKKLRKMTA